VALSWCLLSEIGTKAATCKGSKTDVCFLCCVGAKGGAKGGTKGRAIQPHIADDLAGDFRCCCNSHAH